MGISLDNRRALAQPAVNESHPFHFILTLTTSVSLDIVRKGDVSSFVATRVPQRRLKIPRREYSPSADAIGPCTENIPPRLTRFVRCGLLSQPAQEYRIHRIHRPITAEQAEASEATPDSAADAATVQDVRLGVSYVKQTNDITSCYGSSCANNGKDALNTPETLPYMTP
eukprot:8931699-Pyramimonas_sp.AAC.1